MFLHLTLLYSTSPLIVQAKLVSQNQKVTEHEAALKASNEEVEGLKQSRDTLIDRLDECEVTLRGARNRIEELDDELASTQVTSTALLCSALHHPCSLPVPHTRQSLIPHRITSHERELAS